MQMQADFLGVIRATAEANRVDVLGAAYLAGLGVGFWPSTVEIKKFGR